MTGCLRQRALSPTSTDAVMLLWQLCQRPLNGDLRKPNYNNDYIAPLFRDHLMPARKFLYSLPFANSIYKVGPSLPPCSHFAATLHIPRLAASVQHALQRDAAISMPAWAHDPSL